MDANPAEPPRKRGQFALRSLLLLFVALQVLLGLTAYLRHVGFVFSCYAVLTSLGWWFGKWRLMTAALTGLLVFTITYLACWVGMGYQSSMHYRALGNVQYDLIRMEELLVAYENENGEFPASLSDLADQENRYLEFDRDGDVLDPWGFPYHYRKTADGFELTALGRDAALGGTGLDADIRYDEAKNPPESRLPLQQFLFETPGSNVVFFSALVASVLAMNLWFFSASGSHGTRGGAHPSLKATVIGIASMTAMAVIVTFILAAFHVAASQSAH